MQGFNPADVPTAYGDTLTFWDWKQRKVTQTVKLGPDGLIPLELRFLHDPAQPHGFVGAALSSNVIHFTKVGCSPDTSVRCLSQRLYEHTATLPPAPAARSLGFQLKPGMEGKRMLGARCKSDASSP